MACFHKNNNKDITNIIIYYYTLLICRNKLCCYGNYYVKKRYKRYRKLLTNHSPELSSSEYMGVIYNTRLMYRPRLHMLGHTPSMFTWSVGKDSE